MKRKCQRCKQEFEMDYKHPNLFCETCRTFLAERFWDLKKDKERCSICNEIDCDCDTDVNCDGNAYQ